MTPREIVKCNLTFRNPSRIGMTFTGEGRMNDMICGGLAPSKEWEPKRWVAGNVEYYDDEWGNVWRRIVGQSAGGEIHAPAIRDWGMLADLRLPDYDADYRFEPTRKVFTGDWEHYRLGSLPGFPFAICRYLRKMEIYFQDLICERENIDALHERVTQLLERVIEKWADAGADGVFFCEDWGVQDRLLVHPTMFREIFKPLFARLCLVARRCGLDVVMHSCGYVWDIIDDLAEVGICCLQFDQPAIYGLERLAEKLQSLKVCLWSPVDIQQVLPRGNRAQIEAEAKKMAALFSGEHGGFIAKNYGDLHGIGVQPEWDAWAYQVFRESCGSE